MAEQAIVKFFSGGKIMELTGTNKAMDLWWQIVFEKDLAQSEQAKQRVLSKYNSYIAMNGKNRDKEIESWNKIKEKDK